MKARMKPKFSKKEKMAIQKVAEDEAQRGIMRAQWLMMVALNDILGIGEQRLLKVLNRYFELVNQYADYKSDDEETADLLLEYRVKRLLPNVFTKLYDNGM